jgi:hypothetical protein
MMPLEIDTKTIIVDTKNQTHFPASASTALSLSLLSGCEKCFYNGNLISHDKNEPREASSKMMLSLSALIKNVCMSDEAMTISYKRSFMNKTFFKENEIQLIAMLQEKKIVALNMLTQ